MSKKYDFRDVSLGLQKLRDFLLGRKHTLHCRFPPNISPRTIPQPDIPIGPETKYSAQYYYKRSAASSVKPPVVAPVAEGSKKAGGMPAECISFNGLPTPGQPWWWDGHCFYTQVPDVPPKDCSPCGSPSQSSSVPAVSKCSKENPRCYPK